jgi:diguanylate cyclase (GGDEF)-like protein
MGALGDPTPEVTRARQYAARVRIVVAATGLAVLAVDPAASSNAAPAAIGFAVIGITGVFEHLVHDARWLNVEEALSCAAAILIVGFANGQVDVTSILWLVGAAAGVLARGGRVGWLGRALVIGALFSPIVTQGGISAEALGFATGSIALLLATGRISRETADLLRRARHDAAHDSLTGLFNRGAFRAEVNRLTQSIADHGSAGLIILDLDDFGAVNKRLGHANGDRLLVGVAQRMRATLRRDDVIGRVGGDEFAALVFSDDPLPVADRLVRALRDAGGFGGTTACAGTARCPRDGVDAESLLAAADVALRLSKRGGPGAVGAYNGAPIAAADENGAHAALKRLCEGEGVEMLVQPIVDVATGVPHAYEALARFATRGGQGPRHWFTLADELGMRTELELACMIAALRLQPSLPAGARLSFNLSAALLLDSRTQALLRDADDPARIIVEVTEETLVRQGAMVDEAIGHLRDQGMSLAVDDVGTGYSGLGQIANLRPTYVKLDRVLVRGIDHEPARVGLVRALAEYARGVDGMLVAEGVETAEELAHVQAAGAPLVQGYLIARPGEPWPEVSADALVQPPVALAG